MLCLTICGELFYKGIGLLRCGRHGCEICEGCFCYKDRVEMIVPFAIMGNESISSSTN